MVPYLTKYFEFLSKLLKIAKKDLSTMGRKEKTGIDIMIGPGFIFNDEEIFIQ